MRTSNTIPEPNVHASSTSGSSGGTQNILERELGRDFESYDYSNFSEDDFIRETLGNVSEDLGIDLSDSNSDPFFDISQEEELGKPTSSQVRGATIMGIFISIVLSIVIYGLYMNFIKYPAKLELPENQTGIYCIRNWEKSIYLLESLDEDSYIAKEVTYANGDEDRLAFYKKMISTVSYTSSIVNAKNVYGNDLIDRKTDEVVQEESSLYEGEEVTLSYIDYSKIEIDKNKVSELMATNKLTLGDVDYSNKLVKVFCQYMDSLSVDDLPIKKEPYVPNMVQNPDKTYEIQPDEDIYIDKLIFSSDDFHDLLLRFSLVAGEVSKGTELQPTKEWNTWNALSASEKETTKEPSKYSYKDIISMTWCGAYYLQNDYTVVDNKGNVINKSISAEVGKGTSDDPAGLNTGVITSVYSKEKRKDGSYVDVSFPIRVTLIDYGVSEDAIKWAENKDTKNRGIDITSEVQYCYYIFQVTNLSDRELHIKDNSSLCDVNANLAPRTGTLYGLKDEVLLKPDETGIIESWSSSTELNRKYLIWGADFARRSEPVWFRVLAGNIDDPSEDKGVKINKTRKGEEVEDNTN